MTAEGPPRETTLAFVRHGEAVSNAEKRFGGHGPAPLTPRGHAQARATASRLVDWLDPTALVSSDLPRATETAEHIARATGLAIQTTTDLRERGLGRMDGLLFEEARSKFPDDWERLVSRDPDWRSPGGGESTRGVFDRIGRAVDRVVREHAGGRVVLVSHGVAIYFAFAHICGIDPFRQRTRIYINVGNCSITRAACRDGVWRLDGLNELHHLPHELREP